MESSTKTQRQCQCLRETRSGPFQCSTLMDVMSSMRSLKRPESSFSRERTMTERMRLLITHALLHSKESTSTETTAICGRGKLNKILVVMATVAHMLSLNQSQKPWEACSTSTRTPSSLSTTSMPSDLCTSGHTTVRLITNWLLITLKLKKSSMKSGMSQLPTSQPALFLETPCKPLGISPTEKQTTTSCINSTSHQSLQSSAATTFSPDHSSFHTTSSLEKSWETIIHGSNTPSKSSEENFQSPTRTWQCQWVKVTTTNSHILSLTQVFKTGTLEMWLSSWTDNKYNCHHLRLERAQPSASQCLRIRFNGMMQIKFKQLFHIKSSLWNQTAPYKPI